MSLDDKHDEAPVRMASCAGQRCAMCDAAAVLRSFRLLVCGLCAEHVARAMHGDARCGYADRAVELGDPSVRDLEAEARR